MPYKIFGIVVFLLIVFGSFTFIGNIISSNQLVESEGKILFTARATGHCAVGWGYGVTGESTSDAYIEPGKGVVINFGTMPYHSLTSPFLSNYLVNYNEVDVLWKLREKTLLNLNWEHEGVRYHLQAICTPLEQTTCRFSMDQKGYVICFPPGYEPEDHESNCMVYTGSYRNGSKTERISGYAVLLAVAEENASSQFPEPIIGVWLFSNQDGGEIEPLLMTLWSKNGWEINDIQIEKANTFHVNFWTL